MAIITEYHVIADMYPVSPITNPSIVAGQWVMLNTSGQAIKATGASSTRAIGPAGDSTVEETTTGKNNTAYQAELVISPSGLKVNTTVRASDPSHNETAASSKITVYHGGGKFHTDEYEADAFVVGDPLYVSGNGKVTRTASANSQIVGVLVVAPRDYPSGVPGTDTVDGSITLGQYLTFVLLN